MSSIPDIIGMVFIGFGLAFDLFGCIGLVRLPDVYNRLQAATKCVTLGTCSILLGTFLVVGPTGAGVKCLLCIVFVILTSPVAAHAIARGGHRAGIKLWEGSIVDRYAEDKEGEGVPGTVRRRTGDDPDAAPAKRGRSQEGTA